MKQKFNNIQLDSLGTHWEFEIIDDDISNDKHHLLEKQIINCINEFENNYSRFKTDSIISQLDSQSYINNPSDELLNMFNFAKKMFDVSKGAFNISVVGVLNSIGYGSSTDGSIAINDLWNYIDVSKKYITIPPGVSIDLGGFGKGWLIDKIVELLRKNNIKQFVVNGGGDLFVQSNNPIEITLEHPINPKLSIGKTFIQNGALAVSSTVKRAWEKDGVKYHHIINPKTNNSANTDIVCAFVKADTALIADTMATILIVKPELNNKLSKRYDLKTILLPIE